MPAEPRDVTVEVREGEYITARGTCKITWLVRINDGWAHVSEWPGVEVERCEAKSGVVWQTLTRLAIRSGSRLIRVESRPAPYARRDALDYLKRSPNVARRVLRQEFRVGIRGDLLRFVPKP
jgi:hypothetical protein